MSLEPSNVILAGYLAPKKRLFTCDYGAPKKRAPETYLLNTRLLPC